jgi:hypothetical protein
LLNSIVKLLITVHCWVRTRSQALDFRFQLGDPRLHLLDHRGDLPLREPSVDVLRAVHVPGIDREQDRPFRLAGIRRLAEPLLQCRVSFDDPPGPPQLHPPFVRVVHQEDERFRILG